MEAAGWRLLPSQPRVLAEKISDTGLIGFGVPAGHGLMKPNKLKLVMAVLYRMLHLAGLDPLMLLRASGEVPGQIRSPRFIGRHQDEQHS